VQKGTQKEKKGQQMMSISTLCVYINVHKTAIMLHYYKKKTMSAKTAMLHISCSGALKICLCQDKFRKKIVKCKKTRMGA